VFDDDIGDTELVVGLVKLERRGGIRTPHSATSDPNSPRWAFAATDNAVRVSLEGVVVALEVGRVASETDGWTSGRIDKFGTFRTALEWDARDEGVEHGC
jgi:hypothetical protein